MNPCDEPVEWDESIYGTIRCYVMHASIYNTIWYVSRIHAIWKVLNLYGYHFIFFVNPFSVQFSIYGKSTLCTKCIEI